MNRICLRPQVLEKIFSESANMDFLSFLEMSNRIDKIVFKQNIIDYVEILFEGIDDKNRIRFEDIVAILRHRIT